MGQEMIGWTIADWTAAYRGGEAAADLLPKLLSLCGASDPAWITLVSPEALAVRIAALQVLDPATHPLWGVPFAVKDNIDVAGLPTTAACPAFAYAPSADGEVVRRLLAAGAVVLGKTNLDQFATGLVGVRSPYGAVSNSFDPSRISGGSSSGSASVVARGLVPFALGTDTAGSGRVPAGLNNIVGLKPTRGALSGTGLVPACRTLDCISIFATTVEDAASVSTLAAGFDPVDGYSRVPPASPRVLPSRPRFGVPIRPEFFGDTASADAFDAALERLADFGEIVPLDFGVVDEVASLLYQGPFVAERYAAIEGFMSDAPEAVHPVVREIILGARKFSAADGFKALYRLADLKRAADALIGSVDALAVPTAPTFPTIAAVEADPIRLNSQLGKYTNFVNLLDWSALALPAGFRVDGLPFGITLIGPAWGELSLAAFGAGWQAALDLPRGATGLPFVAPNAAPSDAPPTGHIRIAVVGAHLTGMPLNRELTERRARFVAATVTAPGYRLYALADTIPPKPGLVRDETGAAIAIELWDMPLDGFGSFVAGIPAPLGIGTLSLADGGTVKGFICEPWAIARATDITAHGGWRAYLAAAR
jgi:allophanate hydrolase